MSKTRQEDSSPRQKMKTTSRRNIKAKKNQLDYNEEFALQVPLQSVNQSKDLQLVSCDSSIPSLPKLTEQRASVD